MATQMIVSSRDLAREYMLTIAQINLLLSGSQTNSSKIEGYNEVQSELGRDAGLLNTQLAGHITGATNTISTISPASRAAVGHETKGLLMRKNAIASDNISLCNPVAHSTTEQTRTAKQPGTSCDAITNPDETKQLTEFTSSCTAAAILPCANSDGNTKVVESTVTAHTCVLMPCHTHGSSSGYDHARVIQDNITQSTEMTLPDSQQQRSNIHDIHMVSTVLQACIAPDTRILTAADVHVCSHPRAAATNTDAKAGIAAEARAAAAAAAATMATATNKSNDTGSENILAKNQHAGRDCNVYQATKGECEPYVGHDSLQLLAACQDITDRSLQGTGVCSNFDSLSLQPTTTASPVPESCCSEAQQVSSYLLVDSQVVCGDCGLTNNHLLAMLATTNTCDSGSDCSPTIDSQKNMSGAANSSPKAVTPTSVCSVSSKTSSNRPSHLLSCLPELKVDRHVPGNQSLAGPTQHMHEGAHQSSDIGQYVTSGLTNMPSQCGQQSERHSLNQLSVACPFSPDLPVPHSAALYKTSSPTKSSEQGKDYQDNILSTSPNKAYLETAILPASQVVVETERFLQQASDGGSINTAQSHLDLANPHAACPAPCIEDKTSVVSDTNSNKANHAAPDELEHAVENGDKANQPPAEQILSLTLAYDCGQWYVPDAMPLISDDVGHCNSSPSRSSTPSGISALHPGVETSHAQIASHSQTSMMHGSGIDVATSQDASMPAQQDSTLPLAIENQTCMPMSSNDRNDEGCTAGMEWHMPRSRRQMHAELKPLSLGRRLTGYTKSESGSSCSSSDDDPCRWISRAALIGKPLQHLPSSSSDEEIDCHQQQCLVRNSRRQNASVRRSHAARVQQLQKPSQPVVKHPTLGSVLEGCLQGDVLQQHSPHNAIQLHLPEKRCREMLKSSPACTGPPAMTALQQLIIGTHSIAQAAAAAAQCLPSQASTCHVRSVRQHIFMALDHLSQALGAIAEAHSHQGVAGNEDASCEPAAAQTIGMSTGSHFAILHTAHHARHVQAASALAATCEQAKSHDKASVAESFLVSGVQEEKLITLSSNRETGDKVAVMKAPEPLKGVLLELCNGIYRLVR